MNSITLITLGSRKTTYYFLALALELKNQGFSACLAAPVAYGPEIKNQGVPFLPMEAVSDEGLSMGFRRQVLLAARSSALLATDVNCLDSVRAALEGQPCQLIALAADEAGLTALQMEKGGRVSNRGLASAFTILKKLLLPGRNHSKEGQREARVWYNLSPSLFSQGTTRQLRQAFTGQWQLPECLLEQLCRKHMTPGLSEWLYHGGRPVYFDFSGAPEQASQALLELVERVSQRIGCRAIIRADWKSVTITSNSRNFYFLKKEAGEWIFSHCAAIVHYSGYTSILEGLKAGVPNVLCGQSPLASSWGRLLENNSIGVYLPGRPCTAAGLEAAIDRALSLPAVQAAAKLRQAIVQENGLSRTAQMLSRQLRPSRRKAAAV